MKLTPCWHAVEDAGPGDLLGSSRDGKGLEYTIVRLCEYVQ